MNELFQCQPVSQPNFSLQSPRSVGQSVGRAHHQGSSTASPYGAPPFFCSHLQSPSRSIVEASQTAASHEADGQVEIKNKNKNCKNCASFHSSSAAAASAAAAPFSSLSVLRPRRVVCCFCAACACVRAVVEASCHVSSLLPHPNPDPAAAAAALTLRSRRSHHSTTFRHHHHPSPSSPLYHLTHHPVTVFVPS